MDLKSALAALDAHEPGSLLELRETQWLDAKAAPYELASPRAVEELAKDVGAFANGGGGVIVIGIATRPEHDEEVLDHIVGVEPAAVNLDQIRKLIRAQITPSLRGVRVGWSGEDERVVFIHVPAQAVDTLFVVPAPVGKPGSARPDTVAVPVRDGDSTHWLLRTEIQQLLSAGVRASGMPTAQALAELVRDAVAGTEPTAIRIGQGLPDRERELRDAHRQLTGAGLGQPAGEAWAHGPAALQDLHHVHDEEPGWVLCLVPGRSPVAVAAPVWQAIIEAGHEAAGQDPLAAVGYPVAPAADGQPWVVPADAQSVDLDGGSWGAGRLARPGNGTWRWQPLPRFSLHQGRSATNWTAGQTPALRLRAVLNLPWAGPGGLEITKHRRDELEQLLQISALSGALTMLSQRRGADLPAARWERGAYGNSSRAASYTCTISSPDGSPAVSAALMLALPTSMESTVVACAEVLVEDSAAWAAAVGPSWETQLHLEEAQAALLGAWRTAAELLPGLVDAGQLPWAAPPTTELRLSSERPATNGVLPALDTLVDLAPFGTSDGSRPVMAVTITGDPLVPASQRRDLTRRALVHMAREFGYIDAELNALQ
ncbi:RNA-binding domain-containing protein [Streptomyces sp. NPDC059949]|uniref:RNA-binding domain-containing protein n=1 Tax=Streptomyces sp. NPDC059949 TaxID=3347013 RepID=UPI0036566609